MPNAAEHIQQKLPSMYHQFKELAQPRHHAASRWKSARRRTTSWAACAWTATRRCRACPACSPAASAPPASTAPTASAATRCPTCSFSASAPANTRPSTPGSTPPARCRTPTRSRTPRGGRWSRSTGRAAMTGPFQIQHDLQEMMQDLVGIVRTEDEMLRALEGCKSCGDRARRVRVVGNREYNPGWHTALDLHNLLTVSEAITRAALRAQGEPRRPVPRRLPQQGRPFRQGQRRRPQGDGWPNAGRRDAHPRDAGGVETDHRGEQVAASGDGRETSWLKRPSVSGAATPRAVSSTITRPRSARAWSCSTPSTRSRRRRPTTWPAAGTARPASAARARPRSTASRASCA